MNPILINIPMPLETARLTMRPPMPGDGAELNKAVNESFAELQPWMPWAQNRPTLEESEINVREAYSHWILRRDLRLALFEKNTGNLIGGSGLHRIDWQARRFEIGYWVRTSFSGQGLITEAVAAIARFAFQELEARRVQILCDADNFRSIKVAERLGFILEAKLHHNATKAHANHLRDTLIYARFSSDGLP